jgi:hypothetical protein
MNRIEPLDVLKRGQQNLAGLNDDEKLVFAIMQLEDMSVMEGWDHFFVYSDAFEHYELMKAGLVTAGDDVSVDILSEYESWLAASGVPFTADAINAHLETLTEEDLLALPDWQKRFEDRTGERWDLISAHLRRKGVELVV